MNFLWAFTISVVNFESGLCLAMDVYRLKWWWRNLWNDEETCIRISLIQVNLKLHSFETIRIRIFKLFHLYEYYAKQSQDFCSHLEQNSSHCSGSRESRDFKWPIILYFRYTYISSIQSLDNRNIITYKM